MIRNVRNINAVFLISNFIRVLNVVSFILGDSSASEYFMCRRFGIFCLFHLHRCCEQNNWYEIARAGLTQTFCVTPNLYKYLSNFLKVIIIIHTTYEDGTECSEKSAHKILDAVKSTKRKNTTQ